MPTPTSSNGINTSATHEATLDRSKIGSPADGRKLNGTGEQGSSVTSGMAASQNSELRPVTVNPVDFKTVTGSFAGDHRTKTGDVAKDSVNRAADNGGPREAMRGQQNSKFYNENAKPSFESSPGNLADSDAGN